MLFKVNTPWIDVHTLYCVRYRPNLLAFALIHSRTVSLPLGINFCRFPVRTIPLDTEPA